MKLYRLYACICSFFLCILATVLFSTAQLAARGEGSSSSNNGPTVLVMPKLIGTPYFSASEIGAKGMGETLGISVLYIGSSTADASEQVRILEDMISRGVDVIAVAPNDATALTPVLKRARNAGIAVLDWDTPAEPSVVDYSVQQIDNKVYGASIFLMC